MPGFHHILFPVDFSEPCRAIYPFVKTLAGRLGARVSLLNAVHVLPVAYGSFAATYPVVIDEKAIQRDAEDQLANFAATISGDEVSVHCPLDEPSHAISDYVRRHDVDLVMMPTHGYGPFRGLLLGSLTAKVLHDVEVPVWTAAHASEVVLNGHVKCQRMLCAVDLNEQGVCVVKRAVELAALFNTQLDLLHAVPEAVKGPESYMDADYRHTLLSEARQEIDKLQQRAGSNLPITVEADTVSKAVRKVAREQNADLVIIGRGKLHQPLGRLRTHAYSIIRDSPCPVLSL